MCAFHGPRRFVTRADAAIEHAPWGKHLWFSRPGLVDAQQILFVQVDMPPGTGHQFHFHPHREEVLYLVDGTAEVWVDRERRILTASEAAHIPTGEVHAIYNDSDRLCRFVAVLSPASADEPFTVDVYKNDPWCSLRKPIPL